MQRVVVNHNHRDNKRQKGKLQGYKRIRIRKLIIEQEWINWVSMVEIKERGDSIALKLPHLEETLKYNIT